MGAISKDGFFGYSSCRMRRAAAVLLMRLLAWKRVNMVVEAKEQLRCVLHSITCSQLS